MKATENQIDLMSHALGAPKYWKEKGFYRNYFAATEGSDDYQSWREMCDLGLAKECQRVQQASGVMVYFGVTRAGEEIVLREVLKNKPKALSRSKRRYLYYLEISDTTDLTYGEWLKCPAWDQQRKERRVS